MSVKKEIKFEGSTLIAKVEANVDPNGDGQALAKVSLNVEVDLAEAPDEVMTAIMKKKAEKKA